MRYYHFSCWLIIGMAMGLHCLLPGQEDFNIRRKERDSQRLLRRGVAYLKNHTIGQACHTFTHDPSWRKGELFLFLIDEEGTCYCFGDERSRIWRSFAEYKDAAGTPLIKTFLETKEKGSSVMLNNAYMHIFSRRLVKDGKGFILGCGFYPAAVEYMVMNLVYRTIELMKQTGLRNTLIQVDNSFGNLVRGDSYVFIIEDNGIIHAQGGQRAQIGNNIFSPPVEPPDSPEYAEQMEYKESIRNFIKSNELYGWLPPTSFNNTTKRMFAAKYKDAATGKLFIIGSLYYPDIDDDSIYSLVQKAIAYIKAQGRTAAFAEFNRPNGPLGLGQGRIVVYDMDGLVLANGEDASFVGYNVFDRVDAQGHFTVRRLIEKVQRYGRTWTSDYSKNAYKLTYAERLDLPEKSIIITAGYWPDSKTLTARGMVDRASEYLERGGKARAMHAFTGYDSDFLRGDVYITAFDKDGLILAAGPYAKHLIWSPLDLRDRFGRRIIDKIIATASRGEGWVTYRNRNALFRSYAKQVEIARPDEASQSVIVMAGFFPS